MVKAPDRMSLTLTVLIGGTTVCEALALLPISLLLCNPSYQQENLR